MTSIQDFVDNLNGAPLLLEEFAESACKVEDCVDLRDAAQQFLTARNRFEEALAAAGVEVG